MSPPLQQRVEQVQATAARLVRLYGLAHFAAASIVAVTAICLLDSLLRLHDPVARWLFSAAALAITIAAFAKLACPPLCFRRSAVATAQRIERHFPELGERLSSAIGFLAQSTNEPTAGSADLRRAVIAEAEANSASVDFRDALDRRPTWRAMLAAALALGMAGVLAAFNPAAAGLALMRLTQPSRQLPWPRRYELAFVGPPQRVAKGDDFEIAVVNRHGPLPDSVQFLWRYQTPSGWRTESQEMKPLGQRMVVRLDNVTRSFEYRARGGDDDTLPWTELAVVDPPQIVALEVLVDPPAYTGLAQRSEGRIVAALIGSRLRIRGQTDQPIRSVAMKSLAAELSLPAVEVAADGRHFSAPANNATWIVERSGAFALELTDQHGLAFGRDARFELHALPDTPPSIAWDAPSDHTFATPRAVVPVKATVKDDLAVRSVQLRYIQPGKSDEEQVLDLDAGQVFKVPENAASSTDSRRIDHAWDLSTIAGLAPGDVLAVRITAEDDKPQLTTTTARRLTIITAEELDRRIATRQAAILGQLADALRLAQQCREQTQSLETRLTAASQLSAADLNLLQAAQHNQRQLERLLGANSEGAEGQIAALLDELAANRAQNQASGRHLNELLAQVRALNANPLPAIAGELTEALKIAGEASGPACGDVPAANIARRLQMASARQTDVVQSLEKMVGKLSEWDDFGRIARDVDQIRGDQERLAAETDELKLKAAGAAAEAPASDRAAARQVAQRQLELARRLDKLQTRMEEMLARRTADDPRSAAALSGALDAARRLAIGGQMREAASRLTQLQWGQARDTQQQAVDALKQLTLSLMAQSGDELAHEQLARMEQAIAGLANRQRNALAETERIERHRAGSGSLDADLTLAIQNVTADQRLLAEETDRLRPGLASATAFSFALEGAATSMRQAGILLLRGQTAIATQDAERAALSRLKQILESLKPDEPMPAGQSPPAGDQPMPPPEPNELAVTTAELKLLKLLQQTINDRTAELAALQKEGQSLTAEQQKELDSLAREQGRLADIVKELIRGEGRGERGEGKGNGRLQNMHSSLEQKRSCHGVAADKGGIAADETRMKHGLISSVSIRVSSEASASCCYKLWGIYFPTVVSPLAVHLLLSPEIGKPAAKSQSLDRQLLDGLDRELLQGLPGRMQPVPPSRPPAAPENALPHTDNDAAGESQNPLARIAEQMRAVESRIARHDTSPATQQAQQEIVESLDALLEQARQAAGSKKPDDEGSGSAQAGVGNGQPAAGPPRDSANRIERGTKEQAETADVKDVLRRVWGHLPDKLRDEMQASLSEQFLPKYERLIEEYYKRLAERRPGEP